VFDGGLARTGTGRCGSAKRPKQRDVKFTLRYRTDLLCRKSEENGLVEPSGDASGPLTSSLMWCDRRVGGLLSCLFCCAAGLRFLKNFLLLFRRQYLEHLGAFNALQPHEHRFFLIRR